MKEFWENVFRYPRYFITITLGIFFFLFERLRPLLSRPVTAIALVGLLLGLFGFITLTLRAMLGLSPV
jgi:predicted cobalt transporter CbtA